MTPGLLRPVRRTGNRRLLLELDLTRGLLEVPPASPLAALRVRHVPTVRSVVEALTKAANDEHVAGLVAHVGTRQPTLAQSNEVRRAVQLFRETGKSTACWSESYGELGPGNVGYHLATAFEHVWLQPSGDVGLVGLSAQAVFLRGSLDKLGVQPQFGQREDYKTAVDTFLEHSMTEPHREMVSRLVQSATDIVVADVASSRRLEEQAIRDAMDAAPLSAQEALERGLVDRIGYRDEVYADLRRRLGAVDLKYVERYGKGLAGLGHAGATMARRGRPVVAVVHAAGPIHLGRSGGPNPLAGRSIGSDSLGVALRTAADDDAVKAVVLRVDSPGGSYVASDAIRREIHAVRRTGRPVVASMASVAASGGYYIAMPADHVLASPGTLTGSIGVLAGKAVIHDMLERLGVRRETVTSGTYADMFSTDRPFRADEWQRLEAWLDRVYADFTAKAAEDRGMSIERLREAAKGRVWTGADACELGLVDQLGGLAEAIDVACARAGVSRDDVEVRTVPKRSPVERLIPPENSDSPTAVRFDEGIPPLASLLGALGLPTYGVLMMPVDLRLS
jgi:protease-4